MVLILPPRYSNDADDVDYTLPEPLQVSCIVVAWQSVLLDHWCQKVVFCSGRECGQCQCNHLSNKQNGKTTLRRVIKISGKQKHELHSFGSKNSERCSKQRPWWVSAEGQIQQRSLQAHNGNEICSEIARQRITTKSNQIVNTIGTNTQRKINVKEPRRTRTVMNKMIVNGLWTSSNTSLEQQSVYYS